MVAHPRGPLELNAIHATHPLPRVREAGARGVKPATYPTRGGSPPQDHVWPRACAVLGSGQFPTAE